MTNVFFCDNIILLAKQKNGFRSADTDAIALLRSMGAENFKIYRYIYLPSSLSHFFAGIKISASYAIAGRTTLFNILSGLYVPDSGNVLLDGENITGKPGKLSYMLQKDLLLPYMTVLDNTALSLVIKGEKKKAAREKAAALFHKFGLEGYEKNIRRRCQAE